MKPKDKVRIELHLTTEETEKLDAIAKAADRSRKGFCETQIRKVIKKGAGIVALMLIMFSFGCKKNQATVYPVRFEINGKCSYSYQVGSVKKTGSTASSVTLNENAKDGDYVHCVATADSSKLVKLEYYRENRYIAGQNANVAEVKEQL